MKNAQYKHIKYYFILSYYMGKLYIIKAGTSSCARLYKTVINKISRLFAVGYLKIREFFEFLCVANMSWYILFFSL